MGLSPLFLGGHKGNIGVGRGICSGGLRALKKVAVPFMEVSICRVLVIILIGVCTDTPQLLGPS